ncbi:alpha/beta hydrolase [Arachidicoccus soli]|uniref:Alpha/beta hydrolase n=1 Tax=Arachidicoccus soli TaxID=2341117 RepID=A0A386HN26_9BACT|nr:alpha/beta hydrolase [Arachidicoccus soli]AYD47308.1 alpha/beta hydrolase [Arachidicoccus soli]
MKKKLFTTTAILIFCRIVIAQNFIPIWPSGHIPNSKHLKLTDSIANERVYRVMLPGMYAFFPGKQENQGAAVVICPGGGYERLAYVISGLQLAKWFNTMGITAFVLNYRLPNSPDLITRQNGPLMDAQRAIRFIRANANKWGIDPEKVGIMGSSSGGHLAASAGVINEDISAIKDSLDNYSYKPDFTILVSPVIDMSTPYAHAGSVRNLLGPNAPDSLLKKFSLQLHVTPTTPPCFITDAINDKTVNPMNSLLFYEALLKNKVVVSFHAFPQGKHSIALRNNPGSTQLWTALCEAWLNEMGIIKPLNQK